MPQRQDYVERMLEELRHSLGEVAKYRAAGSPDAALLTLLQAQERLFVRPVPEFMTRPVAEQVRLLALGEPAGNACAKCLAYASLLAEAARTYEVKGQPALARGADQLALHVLLLAARQFPPADASELRQRIADQRRRVPDGELGPEVRALLGEPDARS
jgi:hypothetical protein